MTTEVPQPDGSGKPPSLSLNDLAERINAGHAAVVEFFSNSLQRALDTGDLLIEAKRQLKHGEWLPWLGTNTTVKPRTAQLYMRLAERRPEIENQMRNNDSHLTLTGALAALEPPVLDKLTKEIQKMESSLAHDLARYRQESTQRQVRVGLALLECKRRVEEGQGGALSWWDWYKRNFERPRHDAERIMRIAAENAQ